MSSQAKRIRRHSADHVLLEDGLPAEIMDEGLLHAFFMRERHHYISMPPWRISMVRR
jgi:hypothetical protein